MAILRQPGRAAAAVLAALLVIVPAGPGLGAPNGAALELAVKATYLYKLAPFVSWPGPVEAGAPLAICVQGNDPFGPMLDRAVAGQRVGDRPLVVRRVARLEPAQGCNIAYLAGSPAQSPTQALQAVSGLPVLTVTDEARGGGRGIVRLVLDGGKVRFAIDAGQAEANRLTISSKLLALAVAVTR